MYLTKGGVYTDYGVPLMVGGKYMTLPVMMYQDVIGMLDFGKGSVIGMILLIPALIACILDIMNRDKGNTAFVGKAHIIKENNCRDFIAIIVISVVLVLILLPIASFSVLGFINKYPLDMTFSLSNAMQTINMGAMRYLKNSLIIATVVSLLGTALATFNAYMTARNRTRLSYFLHLMSVASLAIPGIVLGLSYVMFFKGTLIYGTIAMMFLVNSMHFFASPYLMAYNTFNKINENLEDVGATMGLKRWHIIKDVLLPQSTGTMLEMMSYFFVNSMMTISAVSFLANVGNKPIALMITQFEGQMQLECAAFVSMVILAVNVGMKFVVFLMKKYCVVALEKITSLCNAFTQATIFENTYKIEYIAVLCQVLLILISVFCENFIDVNMAGVLLSIFATIFTIHTALWALMSGILDKEYAGVYYSEYFFTLKPHRYTQKFIFYSSLSLFLLSCCCYLLGFHSILIASLVCETISILKALEKFQKLSHRDFEKFLINHISFSSANAKNVQ